MCAEEQKLQLGAVLAEQGRAVPDDSFRVICREVKVITPEFRVWKGDKLRSIVVYTKMCRGEMTRYLLKGRITDPEALKAFTWEGFRWDDAAGMFTL